MIEDKSYDTNSCGVLPVESRRAGRGPGSPPRRSPPKRAGGSSISVCGARNRDQTVNSTDQNRKKIPNQKLVFLQWNAEGIQRKKEALKIFLHENEVDVACIQETHLNSNLRFSIRGYTCFRQDRDSRPKGGILTLVKNNIPTSDIPLPNSTQSEIMGTKLILPDLNLNVYNCYCPPDKELELDRIQIPNNEECLILGDMNSHSQSWGYPDLNARGEEIEDWQAENRLLLLNQPEDTPTFYSRTWMSTTTPDLAFATNKISKKSTRTVADQLATSDHRPILIHIKSTEMPSENSTLPRWNYKKANWTLYANLTDAYVTGINCKTNRVNQSYSDFSRAILKAAKESIPRGARKDYMPNWSQQLQQLHTDTINARNAVEKSPTIENNIKLKAANAAFRKESLYSIRKSWHEKTEELNVDRDGHKLWNLAKSLNQEENLSSPIVLDADHKKITGKEAAKEFIKHFSNVGKISVNEKRVKEVKDQIQEKAQTTLPPSLGMTANLSKKEFEDSLKLLKPKQAPGSDKITNDMLTHLGPLAKKKLLQIFNSSWKSGKIPTIWKKAIMIPILKIGKPRNQVDSYRPISLTSCVCKLMERIINSRLTWILETENQLVDEQGGFRKCRSTEDQIAYIAQEIEDGFQEKKPTTIVWVDLEKAFDKVWVDGLILKLLNKHISHRMYIWIKEYLTNRKALVNMQGKRSHITAIQNGVPQGGVLSPTLFLIFINDLKEKLPKKVKSSMYADDLALISTEEYIGTSKFRLQDALDKLNLWSKEWGMTINSKKTTYTIFSLSTKQQRIQLTLDKTTLELNNNPTYLGVTFDPRLTWKNQIENLQSKGMRRLALMKKLSGSDWGADHSILKKTYTSYVRPTLEYGATVWSSAAKSNIRKIDKVQNLGLRIITGAMKTTPIRAMEEVANLSSMEDRRETKILGQYTKLEALGHHPLKPKLRKTHTTKRLQRTSFIQEAKQLKQKYKIENIALEATQPYSQLPPWDPSPPQVIRVTLNNIGKKSDYPPEILKKAVDNILREQYPKNSWIRVYTDGASEESIKNGGAGILIEWPNGERLEKNTTTGSHSDNFRAERKAIELAAKILTSHTHSTNSQIVFLTDAKSVLESLKNTNAPINHSLNTELNKLSKISNELVLQWIPGHIKIEGNETADNLAKAGGRQRQTNVSLHPDEVKTIIKRNANQRWSEMHPTHSRSDAYYKLSRKQQRIIFRLRTGHNRLKQHMFCKLKIATNEMCTCGTAPENAEHVLQSCPLYHSARTHIWPKETSLNDKLYGDLAQLTATAQFIINIGLVV